MIRLLLTGFLLGWLCWLPLCAAQWNESPMLATLVHQGVLPPVAQRMPQSPAIAALPDTASGGGRYSDHDLRLLMGRSKDIRMMVVYGYARLVGYDRNYQLKPDLLADVEVVDGRIFTLRIRPGHHWSDGHPFTSEDLRYYFEDIASNQDLAPFGPPQSLLVDRQPPEFEVLDEYTARYSWAKVNPFFLPALAAPRPDIIYAPSHYLSQFHARYAPLDQLNQAAREKGYRNWAHAHVQRFRPYKNTNPELPSLQPWINRTAPPSQRFVFTRNPYYHRVDSAGNQLPYIDRVIVNIADGNLIPAKTGAGESDLQARHIAFSDYTFMKHSERQHQQIRVLLWDTTRGAHIALYPNLNAADAVWRAVIRDARFRRALSLAIDRHEINQVIYFGLAKEGNDTIHSDSPLFEQRYKQQWATYDVALANRLLDELGLTQRDERGIRLLSDGRPMDIVVETAGEDAEQTDVLELIADTWKKVGIKLYTKPLQREVLRQRIYSGQTLVSVWSGLENGLVSADMSPRELAPTRQHQLQWPKWGQYTETGGKSGEAPDMGAAKELAQLNQQWVIAPDNAARQQIWRRMLALRAEQAFTIGIVSRVPQPVVIHSALRNVPDKGIYGWEPGAYFGVYRPDTFWFAKN